MSESLDEEYVRAAQLIKNASIVLVMAGAGMSAESGLKTYEEINSKNSLSKLKIEDISEKNLEYRDYCDPDLVFLFSDNHYSYVPIL